MDEKAQKHFQRNIVIKQLYETMHGKLSDCKVFFPQNFKLNEITTRRIIFWLLLSLPFMACIHSVPKWSGSY